MKKRDKREIIKKPTIITELYNSLKVAEERYNELVEQDMSVYYEVIGDNYAIILEIQNGNR